VLFADSTFPVRPAIAVPMQTKQSFECPSAHCDELKVYLPRVKSILTIGWRGLENHFIAMLNRHLSGLRSLLVVSKDDASEIAAHLHSQLNRAPARMSQQNF
jgi:hypothetical protein